MDINQYQKAEKNQQYFASMRPVFNRKALFSDTTADYLSPPEPSAYGEVTVRFRSGKNNIDKVFFVSKGEKHLMLKEESDAYFDYYAHTVQLENEKVVYYFEITAGKLSCFYDRRGVVKDINEYYHFQVVPGFKTPDWAKGAIFYQIYVDRFYNGDPKNDVLTNEYQYIGDKTVRVEDWDKYPATMGVREFYGGDLQGVLDKMDYLQDLGVDVIYFNPLFVSPSNHKYDIQDYDYIDPHFGKIVHDEGNLLENGQTENRFATRYIDRVSNRENLEASNALFAEVVKEAHRRGMKVILDGVFNHCGSFNKWMDKERIYENAPGYEKGAYIAKDSPYHNYFRFHDEHKFPYNNTYDGWWGHDTLPKLDYENSRQLLDYVLYIGRKWVSPPYNVDGWRLDVAADLGHSPEFNHYFWKEFRKTVKMANPNAIILAEHYGSPRDWLQGQEWDTVMNYDAFMEPVTWFLTGMQKHSDDYREDMRGNADSFWGAMRHHSANFMTPSLLVAMNELSNHDHSRFLTRTNHRVGRTNTLGPHAANEGVDKAVLREAVVIQMTWPGAPTIYYGDEAGVCGFTDPDNRRTYPWGHEDKELIAFHKDIIRIHKTHQEFLTGSIKQVEADYNVIGYGRFTREAQSLILVNNNGHEITKELSVWYLGIPKECAMSRLLLTSADGYTTEEKEYPVIAGKVRLVMPPTSAVILRHESRREKSFVEFK
ncbi:MAG: glycoside hydrolase family 13 protein [Bacteroidales bacterium]|nr:glycoside hydrolase family 13 protein [Bacteroidales bacterium]MCM1415778.1 glycoside hydrolase family 13 protein [bacterium]MCM1422728.1 glycoside hydrolase family 13 protein [bacterium]